MILTLRTLKPEEAVPGNNVIINFNPHESIASEIVGTIADFRPGEGFGGCDLVDVRYWSPVCNKEETFPFSLEKLEPAAHLSIIALAEHHESIAADLRKLAKKTE